jgi:hypothetical protein
MDTDDYADIEDYILHSAAAPSLGALRPHFPRWREHLILQGVPRVTLADTNASNTMIDLLYEAMPKRKRDAAKEHAHRDHIALTNPEGTMRPYKG